MLACHKREYSIAQVDIRFVRCKDLLRLLPTCSIKPLLLQLALPLAGQEPGLEFAGCIASPATSSDQAPTADHVACRPSWAQLAQIC